MGQCGCGDFSADVVYRLPRGIRVAVQLYPGCEYCDTDLGVLLHFFSGRGAKAWDLPDAEQVPVVPDEFGACLAGIPMLGPEDLLEAIRASGDRVDPADENAYATLEEYIQDRGRELLREAFFAGMSRRKRESRGARDAGQQLSGAGKRGA